MRTLNCVVFVVLLTGTLGQAVAQTTEAKLTTTSNIEDTRPPDAAALDQAIDRIIAREHYEYSLLTYFHPIIETHIQDMQRHGQEELPWRQWNLRGRADISADLAVHSTLKKNPDSGYQPVGFLQEAFIDRTGFDREHYSFHYVGQEDIEGVRCLVFDVAPFPISVAGRFRGRIWANDRDYTIIRFTGTYMPMHHWELVPTPVRYTLAFTNFDSRRSSASPGVWLPSSIVSQKSNLSEGRTHWDFDSETRFSGYSAAEFQNSKIPPYNQEAFQKPVPLRHRLGNSFWIPWTVNFGLMMTANALTARCLSAHQCYEGDLLLGKHPSVAEIYSVRIGLFAAAFTLARKSKLKGDDTFWHYGTYMPLMLYGVDAWHDLKETFEHSGDESPTAARQAARARLMNDSPPH